MTCFECRRWVCSTHLGIFLVNSLVTTTQFAAGHWKFMGCENLWVKFDYPWTGFQNHWWCSPYSLWSLLRHTTTKTFNLAWLTLCVRKLPIWQLPAQCISNAERMLRRCPHHEAADMAHLLCQPQKPIHPYPGQCKYFNKAHVGGRPQWEEMISGK